MLVLLFLAFGSLVLPVKAVLMNLLSIGASFGVVTWIFQDGHLSGLLGFTSTGFLDATQPILMLASCSACRWTTRCSCCPGSASSGTAPATTPLRSRPGCSGPAGSSPAPRCCWPS